MKVRRGFVSNSSTTSFCIYGAAIDDADDFYKQIKELGLEWESFNEYSSKEYAVGVSFSEIKDNETGAEFKTRVRELVRKIFPNISDEEFGIQQDAYYNG